MYRGHGHHGYRRHYGRNILIALCLTLALALAACSSQQEPSRWENAQQESTEGQSDQAAAGEVVPGSQFNQLFPREAAESEGYSFTYTQEKEGFAEASLSRDGAPVALLSVSDTTTNPAAADKYQDSSSTIAGYPASQSENVTAILVADRFQVQAFSEADSFTASDREAWLQQFDLEGLAALNE